MTWKEFFDLKMILLFVTMGLLVGIMSQVGPAGALDGRFFYSDLEAQLFLRTLAPEKLNLYRFNELLDLFFIYKYSRALTLALWRLHPGTKIWLVGLVPGLFDLLETGTILAAIHSATRTLAFSGLGYVTAVKWTTALLVVGFTFWSLYRAFRNQGARG
jgi:hypothetical protein